MAYLTEQHRYLDAIDQAREGVRKAEDAYRKGGGVDQLNKADRALADAHDAYYECTSGIAPVR